MYLLLVFFPLISFCLSGYLGKYLGSFGSVKLTVLCLFLCFNLIIIILFELIFFKVSVYITLFYWINSELLTINWGFMFDNLTVIMGLIIIIISLIVHIYSIEYMYYDPFLSKFMAYLSLFTFFMLLLVSSDNIIQMFIGWEGVGLCSFLLINFWFIRIQANKAAIKAMTLNRVGDFGLLIGVLFLFVNFKTTDYTILALLTPLFKTKAAVFNINLINLICLCLFIGAIGKSAQIGLHTWLPDAMEGPTPVSALIHAATMVTAGIFLIIRLSFLFNNSSKISELLTIIGSLTAILASIIGLVQNDIKKIVAYSTCSQLGYMVFACGLSDYLIGLFHLINHAFFKALLFLSSGSIIHSLQNEQDIRKLGGLKLFLPFTFITVLIGSLALIGFPFLTGFYSKDFLLESCLIKYNINGFFCFTIGTLGAFMTAFYSFRSIFLVFLSKPNGYKVVVCNATDSKFNIKLVLSLLVVLSILFGFYNKDLLIGFGANFINNSIFINLSLFSLLDVELIPIYYKLLPVIFSLFGIFLVFYFYYYYFYFLFKIKILYVYFKIYTFLNRKWFIDKLYNELLGQFFFKFGYSVSYKFLDKGIFELIGPNGLAFISLNISIITNKFRSNNVYYLLLIILINVNLLIVLSYFFEIFNVNIILISFIIYLFL